MKAHEIRADYDSSTIVVYQAYPPEIGRPAVEHGRFVPPFSRSRMTWIKPSFLWMMERSNWGRKSGQEIVLAVRITRAGWEEALAQAVLSNADPRVYRDVGQWRAAFAGAAVRIQWDPERTLSGQKLDARSIQVGLGRQIVGRYVDDWVTSIQDLTSLVGTIRRLIDEGGAEQAADLLPRERVYPLSPQLARRIGADD
jgi:hypothetical protein